MATTKTKLIHLLNSIKPTIKTTLSNTLTLAKFLSLLHITDTYIVSPTLVYGPSMLPTLNFTGDVLLVDKLSPLLNNISVGDVVLVKSPDNPKKTITKRVLGVGGDTVSYLANPGGGGFYGEGVVKVVVPEGYVWIQGDNVYASNDSRHLGPVSRGLVVGRVFCRVWPLSDFGGLRRL